VFDTWLRALKDRLLAPIVARIGVRISPMATTAAALVVGLGSAASAWRREYMLALLLWLANRALDGLDGALARSSAQESELGGYMDLVLDFVIYAAVPLAMVISQPSPAAWTAAAVLFAGFYINAASWMYLAAILARRHVAGDRPLGVTIPPGLVGGAETVVFYALFFVLPERLVVLMWILAVLVGATIVQRWLSAMRILRT
jgi:phosphatidylglycerophosphate synthase